MDPISLTALAIGSAALGATTSAMGAASQNKAIKKSMESQTQAAKIQQQQVADQAAIEREKNFRAMQQIQGRIRVSAGEAGATTGGSFNALSQQAFNDQSLNNAILMRNMTNQQAAIAAGLQANLASLSSQHQSPILSGLTGGLSGFSTGLSIGNAANKVYETQP